MIYKTVPKTLVIVDLMKSQLLYVCGKMFQVPYDEYLLSVV